MGKKNYIRGLGDVVEQKIGGHEIGDEVVDPSQVGDFIFREFVADHKHTVGVTLLGGEIVEASLYGNDDGTLVKQSLSEEDIQALIAQGINPFS